MDDLCYASPSQKTLDWFEAALLKEFKGKSTKDVSKFVGLCLDQHRDNELVLHQKDLVDDLEEAYKPGTHRSFETPMVANLKWTDKSVSISDLKKAQKLIGELSYLAQQSRPDIAFAVNFIARKVSKPTKELVRVAKRVLKYAIEHEESQRLIYRRFSKKLRDRFMIEVYTDASFADDPETSASSGGYCIFINGNLIDWSAKRLKLVATSTCTAEYLAANLGNVEGIYYAELLEEVFGVKAFPVQAFCDNLAAVNIINNKKAKAATKYLGARLHQVQQFVKHGKVKVTYVNTNDNLADGFTKSLEKSKFKKFAAIAHGLHRA